MKKRSARFERKTKETDIRVEVGLDGSGKSKISTGIPFLDHMLEALAKHGLFDLKISAKGDLHVDTHHTNEDVAIALGETFKKALGDKKAIRRFADFRAPLDEALSGVRVSMDISGRGSFHAHTCLATKWLASPLTHNQKNSMNYTLADMEHFLGSFAEHLGVTLHVDFISGKQIHHVMEATFKALAKALNQATTLDLRVSGVPSTKGKL